MGGISTRSDRSHESKRIYKPLAGSRRLIMVNRDQCMLCDYFGKCYEINLSPHEGWIYCDACKKEGRLREDILYYMNNKTVLPCYWLTIIKEKFKNWSYYEKSIKEYKNKNIRYLHFFRKSREKSKRPIHTAMIARGFNPLVFSINNGKLSIYLLFDDTETNETSTGLISLANLMYHNPGLYEEITTTNNIFDSDTVMISYDELPEKIRLLVEDAYKESLFCKGSEEFDF
jgi:hypothetical protein